MVQTNSVKVAMSIGDMYAKLADQASESGCHYRSLELNRLAVKAYNRAEELSMREEGEEI